MAVANEVWMMENAIYSVLSPEGFASILWKDSKRGEAAGVMKITARELYELGIIERVIPEEEPKHVRKRFRPLLYLDQALKLVPGGLERRGSGGDGTPPV